MTNQPLTFLFMGRSGSGKGTQVELLQDLLRKEYPRPIHSVSGGEEFRKFLQGDSYTHGLSKAIYHDGGLQPAFISISVWASILIREMTAEGHLITDGAARRLVEAEALHSALDFYGRNPRFVVHINVSREWSTARLLARGRPDDNSVEIEKRLGWFDTEVIAALDFFRGNSKYYVLEINGEQSIEAVHQEIVDRLNAAPHGTH